MFEFNQSLKYIIWLLINRLCDYAIYAREVGKRWLRANARAPARALRHGNSRGTIQTNQNVFFCLKNELRYIITS
jgi:hypothetical protein